MLTLSSTIYPCQFATNLSKAVLRLKPSESSPWLLSSRMWPQLAFTIQSLPRIELSFLILPGDSTTRRCFGIADGLWMVYGLWFILNALSEQTIAYYILVYVYYSNGSLILIFEYFAVTTARNIFAQTNVHFPNSYPA